MEVTINDVKKALIGALDAEQRIVALKLEMDYELMALWDAMQANDPEAAVVAKAKLQDIRRELLMLEAI